MLGLKTLDAIKEICAVQIRHCSPSLTAVVVHQGLHGLEVKRLLLGVQVVELFAHGDWVVRRAAAKVEQFHTPRRRGHHFFIICAGDAGRGGVVNNLLIYFLDCTRSPDPRQRVWCACTIRNLYFWLKMLYSDWHLWPWISHLGWDLTFKLRNNILADISHFGWDLTFWPRCHICTEMSHLTRYLTSRRNMDATSTKTTTCVIFKTVFRSK